VTTLLVLHTTPTLMVLVMLTDLFWEVEVQRNSVKTLHQVTPKVWTRGQKWKK